jgi:UDP-glucuronate 4-epimerase
MTNDKAVLVTGVAGFIGFHLANRLLEKGEKVIGIDNLNDYYDVKLKKERLKILQKFSNFEFLKLNLEDTKKLNTSLNKKEIRIIYHLGAQAGVRYSIENPLAYAYSNYLGTLNIFELARNNGIDKVIYASTSSVYGNSNPPFNELKSDTNGPISIYAATKKGTEVLAHAYNHLFGITMVGMRFFTVYGTYSRPDMAMMKFAKAIVSGNELTLYNKGKLKRGFTYVGDIVTALLNAEKIKKGNHLINLGGNELIEVNTLVALLEKYLGQKAKIKYMSMQQGDVKETESDQGLSQKLLKFKPKVNFENGVKEFSEWYLANSKWLLKLKNPKQ